MPILDLGDEELVGPVVALLRASGGFVASRVDHGQITVLADGEPFLPSLSDPLLISEGLEWLAEATVLANEILGRELERQISSTTIEARLRRIRVRFCGRVALSVDGVEIEEALPFYAYADEDNPTLVLGDGVVLSWSVLADAAPHLSCLLDRRMRSLETLLLRLAAHGASPDPLNRPSDEALAKALGCKVDLVREHMEALRTDEAYLLERLIPVVACATDLVEANSLKDRIGTAISRKAVLTALEPLAAKLPVPSDELVEIVQSTSDLAEIRRRLNLDYGRLNQMLEALELPTLTNEAELRRLFETWKHELGIDALNRLRRRYLVDFKSGKSLDDYAELRTLDFLQFQVEWVKDREHLAKETVKQLLNTQLDLLLGPDNEAAIEELSSTRTRNRKALQRFVDDASGPVGAWCFRNGQTPTAWAEGTLGILKIVDQKGFLDFSLITTGKEIGLLVRSGIWPSGMPRSIELGLLGLDPSDLLGEKRREEEQREGEAKRRRSITFAGVDLDTNARDFGQTLMDIAERQMRDGEWLKRSRKKFNLSMMPPGGLSSTGGIGGNERRKRPERLSEDAKSAMGFASEFLASRFLAVKHRDRYGDSCWVSRNREHAATDGYGNDAEGFDFRIRTSDVEWRYEVKSSLEEGFEFEFTRNEFRVAAECAADGTRKYRILYVPFVFDPSRWRVMELPNPMSDVGKKLFRVVGSGSTRMRFEPQNEKAEEKTLA